LGLKKTISKVHLLLNCVIYVILIITSLVMIFPIFWALSTSLKPYSEIFDYPPKFIPEHPTLQNYATVLFGWYPPGLVMTEIPLGRWFLNTILISFVVTFFVLFTSSISGYVFAKFHFKGRDFLFMMLLASMMIPFVVIMISLYILMVQIGWVNTYQALIAPFIVSPFGIFMMRQFCKGIPNEYIDAARIEGCSEFTIYGKIIFPLCKHPLAALAAYTFSVQWDEFLWPLLITTSSDMRVLSLGLAVFFPFYGTIYLYAILMAAIILSIMPVIIFFVFAQRYFITSFVLSGLK